MKALIVKPNEKPITATIENTLESLQGIVGGLIEFIPCEEEGVAFIGNEESKLIGLPPNRTADYDIVIHGDFIIVGIDEEGECCSLTDEQLNKYYDRFKEPEHFPEDYEPDVGFEIYYGF